MNVRKHATPARASKTGRATKVKIPRAVRRLFPDVTKMVEATESVEVTVTPKDCNGAKPKDETDCAMSRAFRRQHSASGTVIGLTRSYIVNGDTVTRFATPASVQREIVSFDREAPFAPGNYHLAPVSPTSRVAAKREKNKKEWKKKKDARLNHDKATKHVKVYKHTVGVRSLRA